MKPVKVLIAIVLGVITVVLAWKLLVTLFGVIYGFITTLLGLALGIAVIGGLGWVILRLLGHKSIGSNKHSSLP